MCLIANYPNLVFCKKYLNLGNHHHILPKKRKETPMKPIKAKSTSIESDVANETAPEEEVKMEKVSLRHLYIEVSSPFIYTQLKIFNC